MKFSPLTVEDSEEVSRYFALSGIENSEHCFATMLVWAQRQPIEKAVENGFLFLRSDGLDHLWYLYPRGRGDEKRAVNAVLEDASRIGKPAWIYGMDRAKAEYMQNEFKGVFLVKEDRDSEDYIYLSGDLATLPGKKYQKKRNHCSKFIRENPDYRLLPITKQNVDRARRFEYRWTEKYNSDGGRDLAAEQRGILILLDNFEKLDLMGVMIEAGGQIVGLSIASPISKDMVDVVVEKANHDVASAYAVINRDFAAGYFSSFKYINREDDMGEENLRKAKLSYFPCEIRKKYLAVQI